MARQLVALTCIIYLGIGSFATEADEPEPWSIRIKYNKRQPVPFSYADAPGQKARVVDWDGDGLWDIVGHNLEPTHIFVWRNVGTKTEPRYRFDDRSTHAIYPEWGVFGFNRDTRQHYYSFDVADWNNDGQWDIIPGVILHLNRGTNAKSNYDNVGPFKVAGEPYPFMNKYLGTRQADLDGDGRYDLIAFGSLSEKGMFADEGIAQARQEVGKPGFDPETSTWVRPRLHFCKNVGTNEKPEFDTIEDILIDGKTVAEYVVTMPHPAFADWDDDGDLDIISGDWGRSMYYFRNDGTPREPKFSLAFLELADGVDRVEPNHVPAIASKVTYPVAKVPHLNKDSISVELPEAHANPNVIDWDGDGDLDIVASTNTNHVFLLENVGTRSKPVLAKYQHVMQPLETSADAQLGRDVQIVPQVVDWDNDGDDDIISGGEQGYISFFECVGGKGFDRQFKPPVDLQSADGAAIWIADITDGYFDGLWHPGIAICSSNFFGYAEPTVIDLEGDGDLDIVTGDISLILKVIENTGTRDKPVLQRPRPLMVETDTYSGGWRVRPAAADFDGDGWAEVIHPRLDGVYVKYEVARRDGELYLKAGEPLLNEEGEPFSHIWNGEPNGGGMRQQITVVDWDGDGDYDILTGWLEGKVSYSENVGSNQAPRYRRGALTVDGELFQVDMCPGVSAGVWAHDWDGDGTLDLIGGSVAGWLFAYDGRMFDR